METSATRRKALFGLALDAIERDWSDLGQTVKRSADRVLLGASDGTETLIHLSAVRDGYGFKAGEFKVNFSVIVCNGPIFAVMLRIGVITNEASSDRRFFLTGSLSLPGNPRYILLLTGDPTKLAARIARALEKTVHPLVERLVSKHRDVPELVTEMPGAFERPFGTAAAAFALSGDLRRLKAFWLATDQERIWDRPSAADLKRLQTAAAQAVGSPRRPTPARRAADERK